MPRLPRGWDRVPRTPVALRRRGRKIYKRQAAGDGNAQFSENEDELHRESKRQCLSNAPAVPNHVSRHRQYAPTLRERRPGTPRRKLDSL